MTEYICKEVQTDNGGYLEPVKELIRCKDCKYNKSDICSWHSGSAYTWCVDDYDYCSCGERKEK